MSITTSPHDGTRRCANFTPNIWGDKFLQYASESSAVDDNVEHNVQKEKLKMFISSNDQRCIQKLKFIDWVQRLGVSYHFEHEIEEALAKIHSMYTRNNNVIMQDGDNNLHSLALLFRLLRQHGYPISSDIFKDVKGKFNIENLTEKDVEGMLAMYEATQLEVHGEKILDEALHFTYTHLKSLIDSNQLSPCLNAHIKRCLSQPLHKRSRRLEARHYMSFYQQQDPSQNHIMLLNFAKMDFNTLQRLHQIELGTITKWWKESEVTRKVPYARDRLVEAYFWPLALSYEPQFSTARMIATKLFVTNCLLDDTYDAFGTLEELEIFTEAIHRWDISLTESLPECMKVVFGVVLQVCSEIEMVTIKERTSIFVMPHVKQAVQVINLVRAYLVEAKWCDEDYVPSYEEYKDNGVVSSTTALHITSFLGLGNLATKDVLDWIATNPRIVRACSLIGRLMDDMATHKFEQEREHVASGVECCMKQYGVSEEEAYEIINNDVKSCWKDINEECMNNPHDVSKSVLDCIVNMARVCEVVYENLQDRFTNGELLKHYIVQLLLDPIPIEP